MRFFHVPWNNLRWLCVGFILMLSSSFGQTFFISVFSGEIQNIFGLSHGAWGTIFMAGTLAAALSMILLGGLADLKAVRVLSVAVLAALAAACAAASMISSLTDLILVVFALRLAGQGMSAHIALVWMARWFSKTRGQALAIASLGVGIGEAVLPLIFVGVLAAGGWHWSWLFAGSLLCATIPIILLLLYVLPPEPLDTERDDGAEVTGQHWTRSAVLHHRLFWCVLPTLIGPPAFVTAFFFLQVHLAESKGWSHLELVSLFPAHTALALGSMIVSGVLVDRYGAARVLVAYPLPMALGFLVLSQATTPIVGAIGITGIGVTSGMLGTLPAAFLAETYGTRHLGSIKAMATALMVFGSAIGPGVTGWIIDAGVDFQTQMIAIAAYLALASTIAAFGQKPNRETLGRMPDH